MCLYLIRFVDLSIKKPTNILFISSLIMDDKTGVIVSFGKCVELAICVRNDIFLCDKIESALWLTIRIISGRAYSCIFDSSNFAPINVSPPKKATTDDTAIAICFVDIVNDLFSIMER